jgi:hypothetical protein
MKPSELYKLWAPDDSIWSKWAKPVLFADEMIGCAEPERLAASANVCLSPVWDDRIGGPEPGPAALLSTNLAPVADGGTAIILDLPGAEAVRQGMALSQQGYRPVPLFNGAAGPAALVNVTPIIIALAEAADALAGLQLPAGAPPVFLLDVLRSGGGASARPGMFDNRWYAFPQDFPSANFLQSRGIGAVVLGQAGAVLPQNDLAHVLLRWQEAGLQILSWKLDDQAPPAPLQVQRPARFRALWYQALALAGLRRNSTGGFGGVVPEPSSGGGYG